jgi:FkbM family methyltransferase
MPLLKTWARHLIKSACRLYPFYSGVLRVAQAPMLVKLAQGETEPMVARLKCGAKIKIRINDLGGRVLYYLGEVDPKISWVCRRLLRPGDTLLDVGANYGVISMLGALAVGPSGRVVTFEPQPDLAELIRSSCELNGFGQVEVHSVALSSVCGANEMYVPFVNSGQGALQKLAIDSRVVKVETRTIDDYFSKLGLGAVRLMKIDVEGHEAEVLRGGEAFFRERGPDAVILESVDFQTPIWERQPVQLLVSHGYELYAIPRAILRMSLHRVTPEDNPVPLSHDYVAVRTDRGDGVLRSLGIEPRDS